MQTRADRTPLSGALLNPQNNETFGNEGAVIPLLSLMPAQQRCVSLQPVSTRGRYDLCHFARTRLLLDLYFRSPVLLWMNHGEMSMRRGGDSGRFIAVAGRNAGELLWQR